MNFAGLILAFLMLSAPASACDIKDEACSRKTISGLIQRFQKCQALATIPSQSEAQVKHINSEIRLYACDKLSCDIMRLIDDYLPGSSGRDEINAQMKDLNIGQCG